MTSYFYILGTLKTLSVLIIRICKITLLQSCINQMQKSVGQLIYLEISYDQFFTHFFEPTFPHLVLSE